MKFLRLVLKIVFLLFSMFAEMVWQQISIWSEKLNLSYFPNMIFASISQYILLIIIFFFPLYFKYWHAFYYWMKFFRTYFQSFYVVLIMYSIGIICLYYHTLYYKLCTVYIKNIKTMLCTVLDKKENINNFWENIWNRSIIAVYYLK